MVRTIQLVATPDLHEQMKEHLTPMPHEDLVDLVVALVARDPANERFVALHTAECADRQPGKELM